MSTTTTGPITAFINFPSPYTQNLLIKALISTLDSISISLVQPDDQDPPRLQWADYDLLSLDVPHANPSTHLISSYIYRKALIRKHQLHLTITEYLAKCEHRGFKSILRPLPLATASTDVQVELDTSDLRGGIPRGWVVDVQFADELDELLMDDLYELADGMRANEALADGEKQWYILKPGFADRAQGIRMFSTEDELRDIFESFEPPSSDEGDYDTDDVDNEDDIEDHNTLSEKSTADTAEREGELAERLRSGLRLNGAEDCKDDEDEAEDEVEDEERGTGVVMSQLRHFVIQEYMPRPMLFDMGQTPSDRSSQPVAGNKFHLRAYVLLSGSYQLYLSRTLLALFSADAYTHPTSRSASSDTEDAETDIEAALRPHLTNTCLQTDAYGAPIREEGLVKLFWELEGMDTLHLPSTPHVEGDEAEPKVRKTGKVDKPWLDEVFRRVGVVLDESVKAGVECGSFGLQLMPNAFEIFGVDLLLSYPPRATTGSTASGSSAPPLPVVTLLEFNASPDFHQSGNRLQEDILRMFQGVVWGVVAPFFGVQPRPEGDDGEPDEESRKVDAKEEWQAGEERWGWHKVGEGQVRGPTV